MSNDSTLTLNTDPEPIALELSTTAVLIVDMQNDFGSKGGIFDRAGIDISNIRHVVSAIAKVLTLARGAGMKIVYLKMGVLPDLSDVVPPDAPARVRHRRFAAGEHIISANHKARPLH